MRSRSAQTGATLFYGPRNRRPDLILAAQFLIDDLRAEGRRIGSLRVNEQTLRLRLDGLELALALSAGPLPLDGLGAALHLRRQMAANAPPCSPDTDCGAQFTDLAQVRMLRALRQHHSALGVLLRQRGGDGVDDLDGDLRQIILALIEAGAPQLILWQPTGVVWTRADFAVAHPSDLVQSGQRMDLADRRGPADPAPDRRPLVDESVDPPARGDRTARRSAGRLFDKGPPTALLPRIDRPAARLAQALREDPPGAGGVAIPRRYLAVVVGLWLAIMAPSWSGLQAMLP